MGSLSSNKYGGRQGKHSFPFERAIWLKDRRRFLGHSSFLLALCFFSVFWVSWPPLGALWARFGRVRASILEVFGAHFLIFLDRFWHGIFFDFCIPFSSILHPIASIFGSILASIFLRF